MDFSKTQVALLVLGYLKNEKCSRAYEEFLNSCEQLQATRQNINKGERVGTRIFGYGLEDILAEYQQICRTVQGYLEDSDYYEKNGKKGTIVEHLVYLLDNKEQRMFTSSPLSFRKEKTGKDVGTNTLEALETDATPSLSLSGNVQNHHEKISHRTSKRSDKSSKSSLEEGRKSPTKDDDVSMVLTQTLLENRELHEKLAETINTVIHNTERLTSNNAEEKVCTGVSTELDALIKTVVQRTEEDPIFNKLLDEINDLAADNPAASKSKTSLDGDNKCTAANELVEHPPEVEKVGNKSIEESNNDAIQSIIAVASSVDTTSNTSNKTHPNAVSVESARSIQNDISDLVVFNNPSDSNACVNPTSSASASASTNVAIQNPVYINTGGGLYMVPSSVSTNSATTTSKIFLLNSQPVLNMNVQPISTPMLSEQDIMSMPVIISDTIASQPLILPNFTASRTETSVTRKNPLVHIAPKPAAPSVISSSTICTNSQPESVTLYAGEQEHVLKDECKTELQETYTLPVTRNRSKQNLLAMQKKSGECQAVEPGGSLPTLLEKTISPERNKPQEKGKSKQSDPENPQYCKTPEERKPAKSKTPKSGSHVRNLDFSSPPRASASKDRANKSREMAKNGKKLRSSSKSPSKNSAQNSKSNIEPKKGVDVETVVKSDKPKPNTWDAKLRELLPSVDKEHDTNKYTKRPQRKTPRKKTSKKRNSKNETSDLSKEAKMLEAAIATPKKSVPSNENCEIEGKTDSNMEIDESCSEDQKIETKVISSYITDEHKADDDAEKNKIRDTGTDEPESHGIRLSEDPEEFIEASTISTTNMLIDEDMKLKYSLRNINSGPKFKKKCNINPQQVLAGQNEGTASENTSQLVPEKSNKLLLLSPSKLNANKRNIVTSESKSSTSKLNDNFITPENAREGSNQGIEAAKRNIMPLLQTPEKNLLPKTPNLESCYTSANNHTPGSTPFTKVLEEHLKGIDLMSIATPKLPITPDFALTPGEFHSTYSNRPTDYSTSSSYYQPSDNEQRSLGQLIKESDRLESIESTSKQSTVKVISDITIEEKIEMDDRNKLIAEHMKSFNRTSIAKKNLNLINKNYDSSSSDDESGSSSSDSSSSKSSDISWAASHCGDTVIHRSEILESVSSSYKLRNRAMSMKKNSNDSTVIEVEGNKKGNDGSKIEEKIEKTLKHPLEINKQHQQKSLFDEVGPKRVRTLHPIKNPLNQQEVNKHKSLFEEINAKRIRTLNAIKNPPVVKKVQSSQSSKRKVSPVRTSKDVEQKKPFQHARKSTGSLATKKRSIAPLSSKKSSAASKSVISKIRENLNLPEISLSVKNKKTTGGNPETEDEEIVLHLSSDDEGLEPSQLVETQLLEYSNSPSTAPEHFETKHLGLDTKIKGETVKNTFDNNQNKNSLPDQEAKILDNLGIKNLPVDDSGGESETVKNTSDNVTITTNEKSVSEADKLVLGLKERGIHLMHNKSPGKLSTCNSSNASNESLTNDCNNSENQINVNSTKNINSNNSTKNESGNNIPNLVEVQTTATAEMPKNHNRSCSELPMNELELEDVTFDQKEYTGEDFRITFNEKESRRSFTKYDSSILDKSMEANVFMEELDLEMVRIIKCTPFVELLHIESTVNVLIPKRTPTPKSYRPSTGRERCKSKETRSRKAAREIKFTTETTASRSAVEKCPGENAVKATLTKSGDVGKEVTEDSRLKKSDPVEEMKLDNPDDELFNWAAAGTLQETDPASPDTTVSPKTSRKRKCSDGEDIPKSSKKKCAELLKKINVDSFLDRVHGDDKCT